jgi:hypothetical protein
MPEISRFLGIVIAIFNNDHPPSHFHAVDGEYRITVTIEDGVLSGTFPKRAVRHVLEWHELHKSELLENWELSRQHKPLNRFLPWSSTMVHVVAVKVTGEYRLFLRFSDGSEGEVDLREELHGEIFEPLLEPGRFAEAALHPELGTVVWPNGADFAPEFLHQAISVPA